MLRRLAALLRNRPVDAAQARLGEALREEARKERERDLASLEREEGVEDVMRAIAASPSPRHDQADDASELPRPSSPFRPAGALLLAVAALVIALSYVLRPPENVEDGPPSSPEQAAASAPHELAEAFPFLNQPFSVEAPDLVTLARSLPIVRETERLKADVKNQADSLLLTARTWAEITRPTLPEISLPALPAPSETPYGNELENLRRDADRAFRSLGRALPVFSLTG